MGSAGEEPMLHSPLLPATASGVEGHDVSGQLESILSDESQPWARRMAAASVVEMRLLVRLAAPAVLVYMINYLMSMSTQILSGHLGTLELAAASLGNTGIQIFAYGLMIWTRISSWISEHRLHPSCWTATPFLMDWFLQLASTSVSPRNKGFKFVMLAVCWAIWREGNSRIFAAIEKGAEG